MTRQHLTDSLKARLKWYQTAAAMHTGAMKRENGFDWTDGSVNAWEGAIRELKNTLDMLEKLTDRVTVMTALGPITASSKEDSEYPGINITLGTGDDALLIAMVEHDPVSKRIQTVSYSLSNDEPEEIVKFAEKSPLCREINCEVCGSWLVHEHPDCPGMFYASSDYVGTKLCYNCMSEYCAQTNCLGCEIGTYSNCKYAYLKENGGNENDE